MNQAFTERPMAFNGFNESSEPVNSEPDSFLETMLGTAVESFVDTATFGLFQPDIIDQESEDNSRIAATVGKVAGSLAGMLPSFGVANVAARGIMGAFKFSTKIALAADKMKAAAGAGTNLAQAFKPLAIKGVADAIPTFVLYDVSREFIRQTKEDDPDLEALGKAAVRGGVTGFFMGSVGAGFALEKPISQALAMGSSMALAETINDASDGEDVLSQEYFTDKVLPNMAMGAVLGLWGSRGVEAKKAAYSKDVVDYGKNMMASNVESVDAKGNMKFKDQFEGMKDIGVELHKTLVQLDPASKAAYDTFLTKWNANLFGNADKLSTARGRVHKIAEDMGYTKKNEITKKSEYKEGFKTVLNSLVGKDSTKEFTKDDYVVVETFLKDVAGIHKFTNVDRLKEMFPNMRGAGIGEQNVAPYNTVMKRTGLSDITDPITWAKMQYQVETETLQPMIQKEYDIVKEAISGNMKKGIWKPEAEPMSVEKVGLAPKAFGKLVDVFTGAPNANDKTIMREISSMLQSETGGAKLTGKAKEAFDDLRYIQEYMRQRSNQVLKAMGKPEISKKDYYMHHIVDREALAKQGMKRGDMPRDKEAVSERPIYVAEAATKFSVDRKESVQYERKSNLDYVQDPVRAIMSMVRQDLKIIYLHEPVRILDAEIKILQKNGIIDKAGVDSIGKFINQHIFEQPTKMTKTVNTQITRWLEEGKIGQVIDKFMLDSGHWLGDSPVNGFAQIWGAGTAKAFLAVNPKMSMLNALQFMNTNGFVKSKYIAKGLLPNEMQPAQAIKDMFNNQMVQATRGHMIESNTLLKNPLEKAGLTTFQSSTNYAIERTYLSGWHAYMDKLTNPSLVSEGWQSAQGIKLRSEMRSRIGTAKETPTDKDWNYTITSSERETFNKALSHVVDSTNFLYNAIGSTGVMRSAITRPFFTLTSYPMNYFYKYLGELYGMAKTGQPSWAKGTNIKLPFDERYGIVKHLVGLGAITAILAKTTDLDYNKMTGTSLPFGIKEGGVMSWSPSPAMTLFGSIMDSFSSDPRTKAEARGGLLRSMPIPYSGAVRQVKKVVEGKKENTDLLFYRKYNKPSKKTNGAFKGFEGF